MTAVSHALDLRVKRPLRVVPESEWVDWTTEAKVLSEMAAKSGLQDKTIAIEVGTDPAVLSKVKNGQARFAEADLDAFMDATGSEAWLHFWMLKRGYDPRQLHRMESDLERENRMLRERLEKVEAEREIELRFVRELRIAA
jgi:hypothetical protein